MTLWEAYAGTPEMLKYRPELSKYRLRAPFLAQDFKPRRVKKLDYSLESLDLLGPTLPPGVEAAPGERWDGVDNNDNDNMNTHDDDSD